MENDCKVFHSNITLAHSHERNNLQELLEIVPAKPITVQCDATTDCCFTPKMDKYYVPKKRSRLKVRTVRDIRTLFEQDTYAYLNNDLEKQQTLLLRKIREGSSNDEGTKKLAAKIFESDHPLTRTAWQMLVNINPRGHLNQKQYVLWKGKLIQINGSRGGKKKILFNFDRKNNYNLQTTNKPNLKPSKLVKRKGLLQNSLTVKFKPGPLQRKKFLDDSHQKYHMGQIELVDIPKPALEVIPSYGSILDSSISKFLNGFRDEHGIITDKWAEFAVSVVGKTSNKKIVQTNEERCITFDLKYKCDKRKILMRQDVENATSFCIDKPNKINLQSEDNSETIKEVQNVLTDLLNSVEISLMQDSIFVKNDPDTREDEPLTILDVVTKEKQKKRYAELDRLAVTVIKLPESSRNDNSLPCEKSYCRLGCICDSLNQHFILKQHCGNLDCMFGCKCEKSKYKDIEMLERGNSELIPGLLNIDRAINLNLAKEEQKFHQTVVLNGQQSILLKERKRNRQTTRKYAEYLSSSNIKNDVKEKANLIIVENKLDCSNIEPWCMVHNLYRCFCKGKFTESSITLKIDTHDKTEVESNIISTEEKLTKLDDSLRYNSIKSSLRPRASFTRQISDHDKDSSSEDSFVSTCARTSAYNGRKFSDGYYRNTNYKILEMEKNDISLQTKMLKLIYRTNNTDMDTTCEKLLKVNSESSDIETNPATLLEDHPKSSDVEINKTKLLTEDFKHAIYQNQRKPTEMSEAEFLPCTIGERKTKLVAWLETSYKSYKERLERGIVIKSLEAPQKNKIILHTWEFVLSRYRERKNLFLVSKQKPHRIFLALNKHHVFFNNCINIDDIRFAELYQYPIIVRNLLTNATDLKDNFCILRGLDFCWELRGSVTKLNAEKQNGSNELFDTDKLVPQGPSQPNDEEMLTEEINSFNNDLELNRAADKGPLPISNQLESSKWFLMSIEDDFTEIQFYKRGFYIKYDSIVKAIDLARMTGKTVRLSSQICSEPNSHGPQFGVYATPNINQLCVFVGPYDFQEQLGLETIKKLRPRNVKKTRGVWIITNKVDNMEVINDPLSFIPAKIEHSEVIASNESDSSSNDNTKVSNIQLTTEDKDDKSVKETKAAYDKRLVKPIKIRRTNGFYHLSSNSYLKNIVTSPRSLLNPMSLYQSTLIINPPDSILKKDEKGIEDSEGVSDIKITAIYSEYGEGNNKNAQTNNIEKPTGMLILKPDEINKKVLSGSSVYATKVDNNSAEIKNNIVNKDVNNKTDTNIVLLKNQNDQDNCSEVHYISDEEDIMPMVMNNWTIVWIQSRNTNPLVWVYGVQDSENRICFRKLNSSNYSRFYARNMLASRLNEYLRQKRFKALGVKWEIISEERYLKGEMLTMKDVDKVYVSNSLEELEKTSKLLENETDLLWNETKTKENEIISCLNDPKNISNEMTDKLQNMIQDCNDEEVEQNTVLRLFE